MSKIVKVAKTIFPNIGASITGYDKDDKILMVLPVKLKGTISSWIARNSHAADMRRMQKEYAEFEAGQ